MREALVEIILLIATLAIAALVISTLYITHRSSEPDVLNGILGGQSFRTTEFIPTRCITLTLTVEAGTELLYEKNITVCGFRASLPRHSFTIGTARSIFTADIDGEEYVFPAPYIENETIVFPSLPAEGIEANRPAQPLRIVVGDIYVPQGARVYVNGVAAPIGPGDVTIIREVWRQ